jgi:hypothetical protein
MSHTNPSTTVHWPTPPRQSPPILLVRPPPNQLVPYSAPHDWRVTQAFTPGSSHPNVVRRRLLDCFLRSTWMHNQACEPRMTEDYSKYVLLQVINWDGCPPIDFSNSKQSLLTVFVGRSAGRPSCLFCDKPKDSIPRALSCVRAHLQLKPFRCEGCQSCNGENGYVYLA